MSGPSEQLLSGQGRNNSALDRDSTELFLFQFLADISKSTNIHGRLIPNSSSDSYIKRYTADIFFIACSR